MNDLFADQLTKYVNETTEAQRRTGVVKWFSRTRGHGFITPDDGSQDAFVHYTAIVGEGFRNLEEGQRVTYVLVDRGKGPQAQQVRRR